MPLDISPVFEKAIKKHYFDEAKYVDTQVDKIFHVENMTGAYADEQLWEMIGGPEARMPGMPVATKSFGASFAKRYVPVSYALGGFVPEEWVEDDVIGVLHKYAAGQGGALARSFATHRERLGAEVLSVLGFGTAPVYGSPDGQPLFSTQHPLSLNNSSITVANRPSSGVDLSHAAWDTMRQNLVQQLAPNNYDIVTNPPKVLVINPQLHTIATRLLKQEWEPTYATTETTRQGMLNVAKLDNFTVIEWPHWRYGNTGWNAWFTLGETHYLKWFNRTKLQIKTGFVLDLLSYQFVAYVRYTCGWTDWRGTYGSPGA